MTSPSPSTAERDALRTMGYRSRAHQQLQFDAVLAALPKLNKRHSVLDVGSGFGDFCVHVPGRYLGIEVDPRLVQAAEELYPGRRFRCTTDLVPATFVVAIASLQNQIVVPADLIRSIDRAARKAWALTCWQYLCTPDELRAWCPAQAVIELPDPEQGVDFYVVTVRR